MQKAIIYTSQQHSVYLGRLERLVKRVNVPATLIVSLEDEISLLNADHSEVARSQSFLLPAGTDALLDTHHSKVALCFLDDLGRDFASLQPNMKSSWSVGGSKVFSDFHRQQALIEEANYLHSSRPRTQDAFAHFETWLGQSPSTQWVADERITKAIHLIRNSCHKNISVAEIGDQVNLSVPRLIQLFKQVTGTPIRRFRLWHRIFITATKLTEGYTLTEAAIAAGFADYAQFSRVYRELVSASPGAARDNTEIRVRACA